MEPAPREETPAEHLRRCGLLCTHVVACRNCLNVQWPCDKHRTKPEEAWSWKELPAPQETWPKPPMVDAEPVSPGDESGE